ncbi:hypothetical protein [Desulfopila aestuarii]|uniref:hypothetical protein n=1 Tax=Desulfopila aestuarii TaxID=231440 RepID=UPI001160ED09|nr:hypothetical protein [Desulfopila aestuarii]
MKTKQVVYRPAIHDIDIEDWFYSGYIACTPSRQRTPLPPKPVSDSEKIDHSPANLPDFSFCQWKSSATTPKSAYIFQAILTILSTNGSVNALLSQR